MSKATTTRIGDAQVSVLSDGASVIGVEMFPGTKAAQLDQLLENALQAETRTNSNANLIFIGGRVVLVDAGAGALFGPASGHLRKALAETGVIDRYVLCDAPAY